MGKALQILLQLGNRFRQCLGDLLRQYIVQVTPYHTGPIGGLHRSRPHRGLARQKVAHQLRRRMVIATHAESRFFDLPLPVHAGQWAISRQILRIHRHQQSRVGILTGPVRIAHAVGHYPPLFRGGRHHIAAGAHAEGVHRILVQMLHQLVVRRGQDRIALTVLGKVNGTLLVFDTHTHGKGLGLHGQPQIE